MKRRKRDIKYCCYKIKNKEPAAGRPGEMRFFFFFLLRASPYIRSSLFFFSLHPLVRLLRVLRSRARNARVTARARVRV